jgi:predicted dehydrogenase
VDYTQASYLLRAKKAARYVSLYGLSRTLVKIRGQYHMKSAQEFAGARWVNERCRRPDAPQRCVALIGCGNYAYANIAFYLRRRDPAFLRLVYDRHKSRAMSLCRAFGGAAAVADWREIVADPRVRLVFIATNHASHAEYALACIAAGKHVHIEKPHVVNAQQLDALLATMRSHPEVKVFLGFNRPKSTLFRRLQAALATQAGPLMINWFVGGHEISAKPWYFNPEEGGVILGNLCHWTDLTLQLVSPQRAFPCRVIPVTPPTSTSEVVVAITFADRSCAAITFFSAQGHAFEGVRETLNVQRGELVANLRDFQSLSIESGSTKVQLRLRHRDHGHEANIVNSFDRALQPEAAGEESAYVAATARLFLAVQEAVASGRAVTVSPADIAQPPGSRPDSRET